MNTGIEIFWRTALVFEKSFFKVGQITYVLREAALMFTSGTLTVEYRCLNKPQGWNVKNDLQTSFRPAGLERQERPANLVPPRRVRISI